MVTIITVFSHPRTIFSVSVKSHFASVENNILSDIRSFHMNMLEGGFDNDTADDNSVDIPAQARSLIRSSQLPLMLTGFGKVSF